MSILNLWLAPDHALVGVDTDGVDPAGRHMSCSKLLPIVHLNAVLAGRGNLTLLGCTFVQLMVSELGDFDALADRLPAMVQKAFKGTIGGFPLRFIQRAAYQAGDEIILVGWSPRLDRPRAVEVTRAPGASSFTVEETKLEYVAPWDESIADAPSPSDAWNMRRLAGAQVALLKRTDPAAAAGGSLIVAELRRGQMNIFKAGAL